MVRAFVFAILLATTLGTTSAGAVAPANIDDEREIRLVLAQQSEAWNRHDAPAWAGWFADDADLTSSFGTTTHGRGAIAAMHAALFRGALAESVVTTRVIDVRLLDKETAVVRCSSALDRVGFATSFGPRNGTYRSLLVLRKESGSWTIAAMQSVRQGGP